jgi:DNA ligase-associated metallophosphoesterase
MKITFAHHILHLNSSGTLYWPDKSMLIVSDLHLEKGSHFAKRGYFLPPYDSLETLNRLKKDIVSINPANILILGDTFHDQDGYERLPENEKNIFNGLKKLNPIWITGNHDGDFVPSGFADYKSITMDGITFNHQADLSAEFEVSGHYHPKIDIIHKKSRISRPCFIEDGNKMILPSFGAYTGGLSIANKSIASLFVDPRIYAIGQKIFPINKKNLE